MYSQRAGQKLLYLDDFTQVCAPAGGVLPWWSGAYAAYDAKNATSYAASLFDLTGNGRHATTGVQPGWTNGVGWILNGFSHYLSTLIIPALDNTWSLAAKFSGCFGSSAGVIGSGGVNNTDVLLLPRWSGEHWYANGPIGKSPGFLTDAVMVVAGLKGYLDGIFDVDLTVPDPSPASMLPLYIGAINTGSPVIYFGGVITSIAIWNYVLSAAQVATISAAMP